MNHKILKKFVGLFGYKLLDKNTSKNERLISTNSFLKIERLFKILFLEKKISKLIQIGANDGERFDSLNSFIKEYPCKSLLVEPIKENFEKLKNNYKNNNNIIFENSAISINNEIQKLYKVDDKFLSYYSNHIPGITSFDKEHLIKHGVKRKHIVTENVSTLNMKDLINKHNFHSIELLCIDAEGYDYQVLLGLDIKRYCPRVICIEISPLVDKKNENYKESKVYKYLLQNGYKLTWKGSNSFIFLFHPKQQSI